MNIFLGQLRFRTDASIGFGGLDSVVQRSAQRLPTDPQLSLHWTPSLLRSRQHVSGPTKLRSERWFMWEGRLDSREEVESRIRTASRHALADHELIAWAFEEHGVTLLPFLLGNWTLAHVDPVSCQLVLARDSIGTGGLYYSSSAEAVSWSNSLDSLVRSIGYSIPVCEEYVAGWLAGSASLSRTPFLGITCVPPGATVSIDRDGVRRANFWTAPTTSLIYSNDSEYEEAFRAVLGKAVTRCLRSSTPIIAELSGGMDSSAIVCVADQVRESQSLPCVHTLSYHAPAERNWDTEESVRAVEVKRGRQGRHIPIQTDEVVDAAANPTSLELLPARSTGKLSAGHEVQDYLRSLQSEVLLSGWGGDELLGGVPDPIPRLATLLRRGSLAAWSRESLAWAIASRSPVLSLWANSATAFLPTPRKAELTVGWLRQSRQAQRRFRVFGPEPTRQDGLFTLDALRSQLSSVAIDGSDAYEIRYPLLDRDVVEFAIRVPSEQWIRPAERRSLMRRALRGIVPDAVLDRRVKAAIVHGPLRRVTERQVQLQAGVRKMHKGTQRFVDVIQLQQSLERAASGGALSLPHLVRTLALDGWLRNLEAQGIWNGCIS